MYSIRNISSRKVKKFNITAEDYSIQINPNIFHDSLPEILSTLHELFSRLLDDILGADRSNLYARFIIRSPHLDKPASVGMTYHTNLTAEKILAEIERILNSRDEFLLDGNLFVNFIFCRIPAGRGRSYAQKSLKLEQMLSEKKSLINICNDNDSLCLARALYVAKQYADFPLINKEQLAIRERARKSHGAQKLGAQYLLRLANIEEEDRLYDLVDVKKFQETLSDYQIIVISKTFFDSVVYCGPLKEKRLMLYEANNHFHVITSFKGFFSNIKYYCFDCMAKYDQYRGHAKCRKVCNLCLHGECYRNTDLFDWKYCKDCNRYFKTVLCYDLHKKNPSAAAPAVCQSTIKCEKCLKVIRRCNSDPIKHHCGMSYCNCCKQHFPKASEHNCFIQPIKLDKKLGCDSRMHRYVFKI